MNEQELLIGAHTSAAGGPQQALLEGKKIGATTIQFFTANQRRWASKLLSQESIDQWHRTLAETDIKSVMSHDSYLINLGSPNPLILEKSRQAFKEEVQRCIKLDLTFLNFHPGAATDCEANQCLDTIVESLLEVEPLLVGSNLRLLLEATAGQGTAVGHRFEHLDYVLQRVKGKIPVGVCIDTCHIFVAGYDIRTKEAWEKTLDEFNRTVGLEHLKAFHLNDSAKSLGSKVDRHKPLGEGEIGLECFKIIMNDPRLRQIPKYLETPGGTELWEKEIKLLRSFVRDCAK